MQLKKGLKREPKEKPERNETALNKNNKSTPALKSQNNCMKPAQKFKTPPPPPSTAAPAKETHRRNRSSSSHHHTQNNKTLKRKEKDEKKQGTFPTKQPTNPTCSKKLAIQLTGKGK